MGKKYILTVDVGSENIKTIIFNDTGDRMRYHLQYFPPLCNGTFIEKDPAALQKCIFDSLDKVLNAVEIRKNISTVALTGTANGIIPLGRNGKPLRNMICYYDARAVKEAGLINGLAEFVSADSHNEVFALPNHTLPKILWIMNNQPDIYNDAEVFLDTIGFLYFVFTGHFYMDYYNAFKFYIDPHTSSWPYGLFAKVGFHSQKLPRIYKPKELIRGCRNEIRIKYGLVNAEVVNMTYDANCALIGAGINGEGTASETTGTGTILKMLDDKKNTIQNNEILRLPNLFDDHFEMVSTYVKNTGKMLSEYVEQYLRGDFDLLLEHLEKSTNNRGTNISRVDFSNGKLKIFNEQGDDLNFTGNSEITVALIDFLCNIIGRKIESLIHSGLRINTIRLGGGMAKSEAISRIKAHVYKKKIEILNETENISLGAAVIAAIGTGIYRNFDEALSGMVKIRRMIKP